MSLDSILGNILAAIIYAVLAYFAKRIYLKIKEADPAKYPVSPKSKTTVKRQFYTALALLAVFLIAFSSINLKTASNFLGGVKIALGIALGFCFIAVWGVFDAVLPFYPEDDIIKKPSEKKTDNNDD